MTTSTIFKSKWGTLALYGIVALLSVSSLLYAVLRYSIFALNALHLALPILFGAFALYLFIKLVRRWKKDPGMMFLLIGIPVVFAFCLFILPGEIPDEYDHICRMFSLSSSGNGDMVIPTAFANKTFPKSYEELCWVLTTPYSWSDSFMVSRDMSMYLPQMYLIPGIFSELFEALNLNPFLTIYLCRGINACLFLVAGYWMLKIIPMGKTVLFIYLLNPMLLQQEASCSADAFVNIVCLLFIAVVLNARFTKDKLSKLQIVGLVTLSICVACSKYAYAPLLLLLFLLLPRIRNKRARIGIVTGFSLCLFLALAYVLGFYQGKGTFAYTVDLLRDPALCISVVANTIYTYSYLYLEEFAGYSLGALSINVWPVVAIVFYCLLTAALFTSVGETNALRRYEKIFLWIISAAIIVLLMLVMREWSLTVDMRNDVLTGVQGRYFLPFALLLLMTGINPQKHIVRENALIGFGSAMIVIQAISLASVCAYFL